MVIPRIEIHQFCILRTPSDTDFDTLFNYGCLPKRPLQQNDALQMWSYLGPQGFQRHDFECIPCKIPPRACRPPQVKKNDVQDVDPKKSTKTMFRIWVQHIKNNVHKFCFSATWQ